MATNPETTPPVEGEKLKIYFLPNLLTAGNLFCGFVALTKIVEANLTPDASGFVCWRASLICSTAASRAWAGAKVHSAANLIRWRI